MLDELGTALSDGGAAAVNRTSRYYGPAFREGARLNEAALGESGTQRQPRGHLARGRGVRRPPLDEAREALQVCRHQVRFFGGKDGGDRVEVVAHRVGQRRDFANSGRQDRPRVLTAHGAPCVAALLNADEGAVQVGNVHSRAHEVLGLLDQARALRAPHGDAVILAPLFRRRRNHHVRGAALKDARLEDVQDIRDPVEHGQLAVPLGEGARRLDAGLAGDRRDVYTQLRKRLREPVHAKKHVAGLLVGRHDRAGPCAGVVDDELARLQGLPQQRPRAFSLVDRDIVERLLAEPHAGRRRVVSGGEVRERAQGIRRAYPEAPVGLVQCRRVSCEGGADLAQAGAHRIHVLLVDDGGGVLHCLLHAVGQRLAGIRVAVDVGNDVGHPHLVQPRVGGDGPGGRGRDVQDGTAGRRGVRENRRHDRCVVAVCGQVDENAVPLRCGFDGILLGGKQVPHALLRPGISVARVGLGGLR